MATGFGVGPDENGNGTTPEDVQRITSAEYIWPGIINRCAVTGTADMSYKCEGGAAVIRVGEVAKVKVPVFAQTIPTTAAPATGTRTDIIYVKQNFPATDGNNAVVMGVASKLPSNALELARYEVPAGATSTNQARRLSNPVFTRPVGGQFGTLHQATDTDSSIHTNDQTITRGAGSFYLWTDSDVELRLSSCISNSVKNVDWHGSVMYSIYVDDVIVASFERKFERVWNVVQFSHLMALDAGRHTVKYTAKTRYTPSGMDGKWVVRYGGAEKFPGDEFRVVHQGVTVG